MISQHLRRRVDDQLAARIGVTPHDLHQGGVHLAPGSWGWDDLMVLRLDATVWVAGPMELVTPQGNRITHLGVDETSLPDSWREIFPGCDVTGPSLHAYVDRSPGVDTSGVVEVMLDDLGALREAMPEHEWAEGGFAGPDVAVVLAVADPDSGAYVAAANLTPWDESDADVGVVVHPDARGQGWGTRVAAAATDRAVAVHGTARWRAFADNHASLAIATSLGFEAYGSDLLVRP